VSRIKKKKINYNNYYIYGFISLTMKKKRLICSTLMYLSIFAFNLSSIIDNLIFFHTYIIFEFASVAEWFLKEYDNLRLMLRYTARHISGATI